VEGWRDTAYLHRDARGARAQTLRPVLLGPFDPVIWDRRRTERVFGLRYRLEIYVPAAQRIHGYYVLPFLFGERFVARVDLKADRAAGLLRVQAAHHEAAFEAEPGGASTAKLQGRAMDALATELALMARWLDVPEVVVEPRGDAAQALRAALRTVNR
jgi:hypothetical protein